MKLASSPFTTPTRLVGEFQNERRTLRPPEKGRKEGGREGRTDGGREGRRKDGRTEEGKERRREERKEGGTEGRKEGGREGRTEGGKEEKKEGRREGRKEGRKDGGREGRKDRRKKIVVGDGAAWYCLRPYRGVLQGPRVYLCWRVLTGLREAVSTCGALIGRDREWEQVIAGMH